MTLAGAVTGTSLIVVHAVWRLPSIADRRTGTTRWVGIAEQDATSCVGCVWNIACTCLRVRTGCRSLPTYSRHSPFQVPAAAWAGLCFLYAWAGCRRLCPRSRISSRQQIDLAPLSCVERDRQHVRAGRVHAGMVGGEQLGGTASGMDGRVDGCAGGCVFCSRTPRQQRTNGPLRALPLNKAGTSAGAVQERPRFSALFRWVAAAVGCVRCHPSRCCARFLRGGTRHSATLSVQNRLGGCLRCRCDEHCQKLSLCATDRTRRSGDIEQNSVPCRRVLYHRRTSLRAPPLTTEHL